MGLLRTLLKAKERTDLIPIRLAFTALALLPFLSEGIAHSRVPEGQEELEKYQGVVERGLVYLALSQQRSNDINDGRLDGGMYAHALATIVFCEAYGLSGDQRLGACTIGVEISSECTASGRRWMALFTKPAW